MSSSSPSATGRGPNIPLVAFSEFLSGDSSLKHRTAEAIASAFQKYGFIYLKQHGIPSDLIDAVFSSSLSFFSSPQSAKEAIALKTPTSNRGYGAQGREKLIRVTSGRPDADSLRTSAPDLKETFQMGPEDGVSNQWPEDETFKQTMLEFWDHGKKLHEQVMSAIALGLGLDESFFEPYINKGENSLRLLHYPKVSKEVFEKNKLQVRAGEHTDYGDITILLQDSRGGLQVQSPSGSFVDVEPIPGTVVINSGDLLARWSNNVIKSTLHRVVEPPSVGNVDEHPARFSVAYFCQPNLDAIIEGIPGTAKEDSAGYEPISSRDHLMQRLTATYV